MNATLKNLTIKLVSFAVASLVPAGFIFVALTALRLMGM